MKFRQLWQQQKTPSWRLLAFSKKLHNDEKMQKKLEKQNYKTLEFRQNSIIFKSTASDNQRLLTWCAWIRAWSAGEKASRRGENAWACRATLRLKFARADHHDIQGKRRLGNADADSTRGHGQMLLSSTSDFRASRRSLKIVEKMHTWSGWEKVLKSTPRKNPNFACFLHRPQLRSMWLFSWCTELLARRSLVVLRRL